MNIFNSKLIVRKTYCQHETHYYGKAIQMHHFHHFLANSN